MTKFLRWILFRTFKLHSLFKPVKHDFMAMADKAAKAVEALDTQIFISNHLPSEPYALRAHLYKMKDRIWDVELILTRLQDECAELYKIDNEIANHPEYRPELHIHTPGVQILLAAQERLQKFVELDLENFYQTGAILLDQWGLSCAYIFGLNKAEDCEFAPLVNMMENSSRKDFDAAASSAIYDKQSNLLQQLLLHFRTYRNKFIVHHQKPWHRSSMRNHKGEYSMMTSLPTGWIPASQVAADDAYLVSLVGQKQSFDSVLQQFPTYSLQERQKLLEIASRRGFKSITYHKLAEMLFTAIEGGCTSLMSAAQANFGRIDLKKSQ
jgi:hypothetical protein